MIRGKMAKEGIRRKAGDNTPKWTRALAPAQTRDIFSQILIEINK
jgi:hypothetical protein